MKYLMVCLGNICRSPMAEGILRKKLEKIGSTSTVASRGFEPYHSGDEADKRAQKTAVKNDVDISNHRAILFNSRDFDLYDMIFVMDDQNYNNVTSMARNEDDIKKVDYIMNISRPNTNTVVPDPYYGLDNGFDNVWNMLEEASDAIIEKYEK